FLARTGVPDSLAVNTGDAQTVPHLNFGLGGRAAANLNTSTRPWTKNIDLRLNKGFRFGRLDWTFYADVRNLLNFKNVEGAYAETGDVTNGLLKTKTLSPELQNLASEALQAGTLQSDATIDLSIPCSTSGAPVNCESLRRVEARFGDGNQVYTLGEQNRA